MQQDARATGGAMRAGAYQIDISPSFEVELGGFASRTHPCIGIEAPIFARALYLEDGDEKLLWVACDVIAFERETVQRVRMMAKRRRGLEAHQVMLSATHTHSAPATVRLFEAGRYSERYVRELEEKIHFVTTMAAGAMEEVEMVAVRERLELAIDRRGKPSAHVDPYVSAVGFRRADGTFIAACVNYPMHPVTHGHVQRKVSPDWCGGTSDFVRENLPGNPVVLVSNGAAGNLNPPIMDVGWDEVRAVGEKVGSVVIDGLKTAKPQAAGLRVVSQTVQLPLEWKDEDAIRHDVEEGIRKIPPNWQWTGLFSKVLENWREKMIADLRAGRGKEVPVEIQVARQGDVFVVAVNGEMFSKFTEILREKTQKELFVVGYANAAFGYIPTREAYAEGGYEVDQAHLFYGSFRPMAGALEMLADRAADMMRKLAQGG